MAGKLVSDRTAQRLQEVLAREAGPQAGGASGGGSRQVCYVRVTGPVDGFGYYPCVPAAWITGDGNWENFDAARVIAANGETLAVNALYLALRASDGGGASPVFVADRSPGLTITFVSNVCIDWETETLTIERTSYDVGRGEIVAVVCTDNPDDCCPSGSGLPGGCYTICPEASTTLCARVVAPDCDLVDGIRFEMTWIDDYAGTDGAWVGYYSVANEDESAVCTTQFVLGCGNDLRVSAVLGTANFSYIGEYLPNIGAYSCPINMIFDGVHPGIGPSSVVCCEGGLPVTIHITDGECEEASPCSACDEYVPLTWSFTMAAEGGCEGMGGAWTLLQRADDASSCEWRHTRDGGSYAVLEISGSNITLTFSNAVVYSTSSFDGNCCFPVVLTLEECICGVEGACPETVTITPSCAPPDEPGEPCADCDDDTPAIWIFTASEFSGACADGNGSWTLNQDAEVPCQWSGTLNEITATLVPSGAGGASLLFDNGASYSNESFDGDCCVPLEFTLSSCGCGGSEDCPETLTLNPSCGGGGEDEGGDGTICCEAGWPSQLKVTITNVSGCACLAGEYTLDFSAGGGGGVYTGEWMHSESKCGQTLTVHVFCWPPWGTYVFVFCRTPGESEVYWSWAPLANCSLPASLGSLAPTGTAGTPLCCTGNISLTIEAV